MNSFKLFINQNCSE